MSTTEDKNKIIGVEGYYFEKSELSLEELVRGLQIFAQPIVTTTNLDKKNRFEILSRFKVKDDWGNDVLFPPDFVFRVGEVESRLLRNLSQMKLDIEIYKETFKVLKKKFGDNFIASLNVSEESVENRKPFFRSLEHLMAIYQIDKSQICLEVNEKCEKPFEFIRRGLRDGYHIAIDDFGHRSSSFFQSNRLYEIFELINKGNKTEAREIFSRLKIKIDMPIWETYVLNYKSSNILNSKTSHTKSYAFMLLAEELRREYGLRIVIEGVEEKEQRLGNSRKIPLDEVQLALRRNIDFIQGYAVGKPIPIQLYKQPHIIRDSSDSKGYQIIR